jgi:large subunit ribosomal protein L32
MAVPKKKTGKCAQAHRRAHWKAEPQTLVKCSNCNEMALAHTVCGNCGYYGGKPASKKQEA